jgi:DNA-binding MarR family transcriptional regulator
MIPKKLMATIPQSIRVIRRMAAECLDGSITIQQFRVLRLIKEGMGQTEIAESLQVSMAAISKMINGLVTKKLVERRPGLDRRCSKLNLTVEGNKIVKVVNSHIEKRFETCLKKLKAQEKIDLEKGLAVLEIFMRNMKEV